MNGVGFAAILTAITAVSGVVALWVTHRPFRMHQTGDLHEIGKAVAAARAESDRLVSELQSETTGTAGTSAHRRQTTGLRASVRRLGRRYGDVS